MVNLRTAVVVGLLLTAYTAYPPAARAATPLEFEFTGVFTAVGQGVQHQVGEQFTTTLVFDPETPDRNPSASFGEYRYLSWTVPSAPQTPHVLTTTGAQPTSVILVTNDFSDPPVDQWRVDYIAPQLAYDIVIDFPSSVLSSDVLPGSLNLSAAQSAIFRSTQNSQLLLNGNITGLSVREVPEPSAIAIFVSIGVGGIALRRRHP